MGKIWIDILTPKQVRMGLKLYQYLSRDYELFLTSRNFREVNELEALLGLSTMKIGYYGGYELEGKLEASIKRTYALYKVARKERPDFLISFGSPEAARVAFGLKIPHICLCDSPHAEAVCRLTIPLTTILLTPSVIPLKEWVKYGINRRKIITYKALDPVLWIKDAKPTESSSLRELGVKLDKPLIFFRFEESFSAYLQSKKPLTLDIVRKLIKRFDKDAYILLSARYTEHIDALKGEFGNRLLTGVIDFLKILPHIDIFIGAGGTMTQEAALYGVPAITCYPGTRTCIESFLIKRKLVLDGKNAEACLEHVNRILSNLEDFKKAQRKRAKRVVVNMEDPRKRVIEVIKQLRP